MNRTSEEMARFEADKEAFAKRLNAALDELGWPVRGRAPKLKSSLRDDISLVAIRKWLVGDGLPELKRMGELSKITGKTVQWLLTGSDQGDQNIEIAQVPVWHVPLISWVSAGMLCDSGDVPSVEMAEEYIPSPVRVGSSSYAVVVRGDSMTSPTGRVSYPDGSIIIVDPDVEPKPPCRVVARVGSETTFKELVDDAGAWYLKPLNPQYPTRPVDETVCICGVVRCMVFKE
ncbi:MAG: S24 family peptidase [Aeromonadaceae bacterium]|nr:S24 family peptidase [Aeromonadaceae bacterium]